jgi:hypothetical protein
VATDQRLRVARQVVPRAALEAAGYYADWKARFGREAWSALEHHTGPLGA